MTVNNDSGEAKVLQVSVTRWTQVDGESVYAPATDVIATPVLFRIPPKSRQLIRVGFASPLPESTTERSYRIYLTEVPEEKRRDSQVRFLLRLGIPMFVPPAEPRDALDWRLTRRPDGTLDLFAENRGNRHVRVQSIRLEDTSGSLFVREELDYLLSESRKTWRLKPERAPTGASIKIKAQTGRGMLEAEVPIGD